MLFRSDIREKLMELERKLVDTCKQEHYFPDEVQKIVKEMDKLRKKLNKLENPAAASSSGAIEICRPAGLVVVAPALSASFVAPRLWSLPVAPRFWPSLVASVLWSLPVVPTGLGDHRSLHRDCGRCPLCRPVW